MWRLFGINYVIFLSSTVCGKLRKTMCGTLNAAQRWREHNAQVFEGAGFSRGLASACHCFHKDLQTLYTVTIVSSLVDRTRIGSFAGDLRVGQSCHLGTRTITLPSSHVPGKNTDTAKAGDRVRAGHTARPTLIESTGADRCSMCGHPGN